MCKHVWIVDENNTDQDKCAKCGTIFKVWNRNPHPKHRGSVSSIDQMREQIPNFDISDGETSVKSIEQQAEVSVSFEKLTDRQQEVARLVLEGKTQQEIANDLGISQQTVQEHLDKVHKTL